MIVNLTCILDAGLREKLNKIMASDYFTTTPEMKLPGEVVAAAAAGNYVGFHVPLHSSMVQVQDEGSIAQYHQKVKLVLFVNCDDFDMHLIFLYEISVRSFNSLCISNWWHSLIVFWGLFPIMYLWTSSCYSCDGFVDLFF